MEADNEDYQDVEDPIGSGRPFENAFVLHADEMFPPGKRTY